MTEETLKPVAWRYEIKYGPDGEANYSWLYRGDEMVATMRTRHAVYLSSAPSAIAEKDRRITELRDGMEDLGSKYLQAKFEAARLRALLAEARTVVGPLADVVKHDISTDEDNRDVFRPMPGQYARAKRITVGHLRAALALAEKLEKEIGNE